MVQRMRGWEMVQEQAPFHLTIPTSLHLPPFSALVSFRDGGCIHSSSLMYSFIHAFIIQIYPSSQICLQICSYKYTYKYTLHHQTSYSSIFVPRIQYGGVCTHASHNATHMHAHHPCEIHPILQIPCQTELHHLPIAEIPWPPHN